MPPSALPVPAWLYLPRMGWVQLGVISNHPRQGGTVSGIGGQGFRTMSSGAFSTPHYVTPRTEKNTALDGSKMDVHALTKQQAKSECHTCGYPLINESWPTGVWRHMTPEELDMYAPDYDTSRGGK